MSTNSVLTKKQDKTFRTEYTDENGQPCVLVAKVQYDDKCNNGHNTFTITGELYDRSYRIRGDSLVDQLKNSSGKTLWLGSCGCLHDEITERFPELAPNIKWHRVSTDGPMHYIANSMYHAKEPNLEYARSSAVWPDAQLEDFTEEKLKARLPALMEDFRRDVESLGFTY